MKVAIFHNYMDNIGGAEVVGLTLARELKADFYSTNIDTEKIEKMGFKNLNMISIGKVPINAPFRQQSALLRFRLLDLKDKYDFYIMDGDWAMSGAVRNKPNLWYVHSPIREIWDLYEFTRLNNIPPLQRPVFDLWVYLNRHLNRKYVKHVQNLACNSKNTCSRLQRYLGRQGEVIYPPIETSRFCYKSSGDYWLSVNRFISHKRVDIQMKAFSKMPEEKLIVVGCYEKSRHFQQYASYIEGLKPDNVEILKWVPQNELLDLYSNCKGFITTSKDEDFGMTPVEAMASGKPVIAPNEGGYRETVIDGITGRLLDDIDPEKICHAVKEIGEHPEQFKDECLKRASDFDTSRYILKIRNIIENSIQDGKASR
jgi:glycosyltransferase involved in cell wall biosynthesis